MRCARSTALAKGLGPGIFAVLLLAAAPLAAGAEFPEVAQLPVRPEMPDPLVMFDGKPVTSPEQWTRLRRPELKALFQYYMYGKMPPRPDDETFAIAREDRSFLGGKATLKEVTIDLGSPDLPKIQLLVVVPNERRGPAPAFLGANFEGNHTVVDDPRVALPEAWVPGSFKGDRRDKATDAGRGTAVNAWAVDEVIGRGYALATFYRGDVAPTTRVTGSRWGCSPTTSSPAGRSGARTTGGRSPPGHGACHAPSITS
jgi:hypothetical protein